MHALSIEALRDGVVRNEWSATQVCEAALARMEQREPELNAMTEVTACAALKDAGAVDNASGDRRGRLAGVTFVVKSNIDTLPAVCDAGLPHLRGRRPTQDAEVVSRLRRAGAVILGTAVTDSGGFGVTSPKVANPLLPDRVAGGSSGGSAVAVAAGYCFAALGTDTGGSSRIPAACCGIAGFKPTIGRLPLVGVHPMVPSIDHVGIMARTVADVLFVMNTIDESLVESEIDHTNEKPILGVATSYLADADPRIAEAVRSAIDRIASAGYTVREVELPSPEETVASHMVLALLEVAQGHVGSDDVSEEDLLPIVRESIEFGKGYDAEDRAVALRQKNHFADCMAAAFAQVDYILMPTLPCEPPLRDAQSVRVGDKDLGILETLIRYTSPFNQSGNPALSLPLRSLPGSILASLQVVARRGADKPLLVLGATLEQQLEGL